MTFKEISEGYKKNAKMRAELGSKLVLHNSPDFTGIKSVQLKSQEVAKGVQEVLSSYKNQLDILKEGTSISELSVLYNNSLNKVASNFVNALSEVSKSWMGLAAAHSVPNGFIEALNESSRKLPGAVLNLADNGWYISRDITPGEVIHLSDLLEIGNFVEVHEYLIRHSESDLEDTISLLTRRHPDRKAIFDEISACYKHKLTNLFG